MAKRNVVSNKTRVKDYEDVLDFINDPEWNPEIGKKLQNALDEAYARGFEAADTLEEQVNRVPTARRGA